MASRLLQSAWGGYGWGRPLKIIFGCALLAGVLAACSNPPYPRGSIDQLFAHATAPVISQQVVDGHTLNTARIDSPLAVAQGSGKTMLLFVHGSPGDWKAWSYYLKAPELGYFSSRVAVDRPGFGASGKGMVVADLRQQARLLAQLIPDGQKAVVVGHSLGGPLVTWMAIDAPDKVCSAISIAGSLSSRLEAPRWYNLLADTALLQWAIPPEMVWSNREMMPLSGELRKLEAALPQLRTPLLLIQGDKDSLVDPQTVEDVAKVAPLRWLKVKRLPDETHFVLWEKPSIILDAIKQMPCALSP
jgi:pimeloyl-ACP methyl ester carboxylesterase